MRNRNDTKLFSITACLTLMLSVMPAAFAEQKQDSIEDIYYEVTGLVYVQEFDVSGQKLTKSPQKIPMDGLKFYIVGKYQSSANEKQYHLIRFYPIKDNERDKQLQEKGAAYVTSLDNPNVFAITTEEFTAYVQDGFIQRRHKTGHHNISITYGASFSVPFKLRPKIGEENTKISPELLLGGYLGFRTRLGPVRPYYLSLVVTAGLATLPVNDDNNGAGMKGDGTVLGVTGSLGLVFQLEDTQVGLAIGMDKASGNFAKDWIYDKELWYSFSIGYSFFGRKDDP